MASVANADIKKERWVRKKKEKRKNGETRQKWAIITSKRPLGLALQALLKQLKGNKTRRPAKEPCLKQHIKSNTSLCAH